MTTTMYRTWSRRNERHIIVKVRIVMMHASGLHRLGNTYSLAAPTSEAGKTSKGTYARHIVERRSLVQVSGVPS